MKWHFSLCLPALAASVTINVAGKAIDTSAAAPVNTKFLEEVYNPRFTRRIDSSGERRLAVRSADAGRPVLAGDAAAEYGLSSARSPVADVSDESRRGEEPSPPTLLEKIKVPAIGIGAGALAVGGRWLHLRRKRLRAPQQALIDAQMDRLPEFIDPDDFQWRCFVICSKHWLNFRVFQLKKKIVHLEDVLLDHCVRPRWCPNEDVHAKALAAKSLRGESQGASAQSVGEAGAIDARPGPNTNPTRGGTDEEVEGQDHRPSTFQAVVGQFQRGFAAAKTDGFGDPVASAFGPGGGVKGGWVPGKAVVPRNIGG